MDIAAISNRIDKITHPKWPHWFDISNYECLETLTGEQFINELEARLSLLGTPTLANGRRLTDDKIWQQITLGNVLISQAPALVSDSPAVKPINHIDIEGIREEARHEYGSDYTSMEPQHLLTVPGISGKQVLLAVDLNLADNSTVLGHIEHQLNQLRKQLGIPEPVTANRDKANEKMFKKLLTYRVIPYLDLLLYSHNHCPLNAHCPAKSIKRTV
ncbi:MAG: DUF6387 family protein [Shewanella sp.]|nr:DUF6387 family protein [Shewanella sp.]MCF1437267.1 DUF6387 family protein [Shewanella sp.]MCF1458794.1 DUF6387 family protein [Shewanella sp.]